MSSMLKLGKIGILLCLALCSCQLQSQADTTARTRTSEHSNACAHQISIGTRDTVFSKTLNEQREVWIHVPRTSVYGRKYPVLFLLDGEFNFESVVGIVKSNVLANIIPEMIVVAIPNTNRFRDLSTSHIGDETNPSGGGGNFIRFMEDELIPYVDENYPTVPYRTIFGHSLGGLLVVDILLNHPHLFDNYLAIDPSLSWDNQKLLKQARQAIKGEEFGQKSIYIAIANTLKQFGTLTYEAALKDTSTASLHLRSIAEFSELAASNEQLSSKSKYYPDESHSSIPVIASHEAFRFLFSWYNFERRGELYAPEPKLTGAELVNVLVAYHERISKVMNHDFRPKESEVNRLGYMFLDRKDFERAFSFFELNTKNFPKSANAHDSMGDCYMSVSDTANAIKSFSMSLELGGAPDTEEKLERLR